MDSSEIFFPKDIYEKHLTSLGGISFTEREVDVISCLLNGRRTSAIASLFSIAPRTVTTHLRNIMLKLECNSQDGIINFIERSSELLFLRQYYSMMVRYLAFEKCLREISKHKKETPLKGLLIYWENNFLKEAFLRHLSNHLSQAGIKAKVQENSNEFLEEETLYIFLCHKNENQKASREFLNFKSLYLSEQKNYFLSVFELLTELLPGIHLEKIRTNFLTEYESEQPIAQEQLLKNRSKLNNEKTRFLTNTIPQESKWLFSITAISILIFAIGFIIFMFYKDNFSTKPEEKYLNTHQADNSFVHSDLGLPLKSYFLERTNLLQEINNKLENQKGIQKVALVGIGGAGKTTLARQYALQQDYKVIWEINAETHDSLINSFLELARKLVKNNNQMDEIHFIEKIENSEQREKRLLDFVKSRLKEKTKWLLIYDNVKESNVQKYFPQNTEVWGEGKIILTTQDSNILNNQYVDVVRIGELDPNQQLELYNKLRNIDNISIITDKNIVNAKNFLRQLPPFPHDIIVATAYLKTTNINPEHYLKELKERSELFDELENRIIANISSYKKTRFSIMSLSLEKIIKKDKRFLELLFLISLLNSQNIPRNLLEKQAAEDVINQLIYQLKEYSLVLNEEDISRLGAFSMHRNIQPLSLSFFKKLLSIQDQTILIGKFLDTIKSFYELNQFYEPNRMKCEEKNVLTPHIEAFIENLNSLKIPENLKEKYQNELILILGNYTYKCSDNLQKVKTYFSEIYHYQNTKGQVPFSTEVYAKMLSNLGAACTDLGNFSEGMAYCEESLKLCEKISGSQKLATTNLKIIGVIYSETDNFAKAKMYLEEALSRALKLENQLKNIVMAEIYEQFASLYSKQYVNKKEAAKALEYAFKSLKSLNADYLLHKVDLKKQRKIPGHSSKHKKRLGDIYCRLGKYKEAAEEGYKESLHIINHSLDDHSSYRPHLRGQIDLGMGEVLLRENNLKESEDKLSKAIIAAEKLAADSLPARIYRAEARIRLGKLSEAYEDCEFVFDAKSSKKENHNYARLMYLMCIYHAAVIKYKERDFKKSSGHLFYFLKKAEEFCKVFLDKQEYNTLKGKGVFQQPSPSITPNSLNVKLELKKGEDVFCVIYGPNHPFLRDYVVKTVKEDAATDKMLDLFHCSLFSLNKFFLEIINYLSSPVLFRKKGI